MTKPLIFEGVLALSKKEAEILCLHFDWPEDGTLPPSLTFFESPDPDIWTLSIQTVGHPDLKDIEGGLRVAGLLISRKLVLPEFKALEDKDWVSESQKLNAPVKAGRFIAYGSHDKENIDHSKTTLLIEAGQAFGTGAHATTKGCLLALDTLAETFHPKNALDLGCGSGVLAIAMAKTWDIPVLATDNDPIATQTASTNIEVNNTPARKAGEHNNGICVKTAENFDHPVFIKEAPFDLILANILAKPLSDMAGDIFKNSSPKGVLVISGLLITQKQRMIEAFEGVGFSYAQSWPIEDWVSLMFCKN